ncbi:MAG TPA: hypothetical protein VFC33_06165 [Acidimicrobiia bacterium]|nr:hypothetical protein [Acidimicrobiia bacterium]
MSVEGRDARGKRALFSASADAPGTTRPTRPVGDDAGKDALYSSATRRPGTLVVECSSCGGRSRVSYVEFTMRQLPVTLWFPWRRHSRLMTCPACGRRTWLAAHWLQ